MSKKLIMGLAVLSATAVPVPLTAGTMVALQYSIALNPDEVDVGDIIEVGMLPAGVKIVDATVVIEAEIGGAGTIGTLSGEYMAKDNSRVIVDNIYTELSMTTGIHRVDEPAAMNISRPEAHTGIGFEVTEALTAAGTIGLTVIIAG